MSDVIPRGIEVAYYAPQRDRPEDAVSLGSNFPAMPPWAFAQEAAEHFHNHRGGWEATWPVDIVVIAGGREWLFSVERDCVATFLAHEKMSA